MAASARSTSLRHLPLVLLATFAVVGVPVLAIAGLRASGALTAFLPLTAIGVLLSVCASYLGAAAWAAGDRSGDVLFSDLMLWGWLRRRRQERQLATAARLLGLGDAGGDSPPGLDQRRRARLLKRLAAALEARYPDTHGHSRRVARHAAAIAKRMGLPREEIARIRTAASIHDVGKIDLPAEIIEKPGPLSDAEFAAVKRHPGAGARMVAGLGDEELARIVRHHHERLDGAGYPDGLAGEEVPLGARIIAVADTFDAVTSMRPYRAAKRHGEALTLLAEEAGTQLDPRAVRAFRGHYSGWRPAAAWALLLNGVRQLAVSLGGQVKLAGGVAAATLLTVGAGGATVSALHEGKGEAQAARAAGAATSSLAGSPGETAGGGRGAAGGGSPAPRSEENGGAPVAAGPPRSTGPGDGAGTGGGGARAADDLDRSRSDADSGGGSGGEARDGDSGKDGSPSDDDGSAPTRTVADTVHSVTDTVDSTAEEVGDAVESAEEDVVEPIVHDVESRLPGSD